MIGLYSQTSDSEEANRLIRGSYGPSRLRLGKAGSSLDFRLWWSEQKSSRIGYTRYGTDVQIDAPPLESWYAACFPTRGRVEVSSGRDSLRLGPTRGAVLRPFEPLCFKILSDDCTMLSVQVSRGQLEDELAAMLGRPAREPIRFALDFDLRRGIFASAMQFLHDAIAARGDMPEAPPSAEPPAMMDRLDRLLLSGLLLAQPHNYADALRAPARPAPPPQIARVIEHIEADPAAIATAGDLARAACLSLRALEEGFRRTLGVSPMRYLRDVRLARARALLAAGDPQATSVTQIAYGCGFVHLGRFAADYRRKYGVPPSQTLRTPG